MKLVSHSLFSLLLLFSATAASQNFTSTTHTTHLIELYTSEGCSSCPPADKWLSNLKDHPDLWSKFIPLAFHVDYWDYIGWKDPFANAQFSLRQRQHAQQKNISSVYTPGMLLNGQEWTAWRKHSHLKLPINKLANDELSINLNEGSLTASYHTDSKPLNVTLNIAILGFNVKSKIESGENNGHTFTHDFVVLGFQRVAMDKIRNGRYKSALTQLPTLSQKATKLAISAWVDDGNLVPIQAAGGWLE